MYPFGPFPDPERLPTEPEQVEEPLPVDDVDIVIADPVLKHRAVRFAGMGFNARQARALALDRSIDTHFVADRLIGRGCEIDIAFQIACSL